MLWKPVHLVPAHTKFDFMGKRVWALGLSTAINILALLGVVFVGLNFGIDFEGGAPSRAPSISTSCAPQPARWGLARFRCRSSATTPAP